MEVDKKTEFVNCLAYWPIGNTIASAINLKDYLFGSEESYGAKQSIGEIFFRCIPCLGNCAHITIREWEINRVFVAIQKDDLEKFKYYRSFGVSLKYYYGDIQLSNVLQKHNPPNIMKFLEEEERLKRENSSPQGNYII